MKLTANKIAGILRENGYKLTPQRYALLRIISKHQDYLSPENIYKIALKEYPRIGRVTIYRTLDLLSRLDLVCRIHTPDGRRNFIMKRPTEHHHHLVCSECGIAVDFTGCDLSDLEKRISDRTGFLVEGHLLELYGKCQECRLRKSE